VSENALEYRRTAAETRAIWSLGNEFLQQRAPWTQIKINRERAAIDIGTAAMLLRLAATISLPIIPTTAKAIRHSLGLQIADARWPSLDLFAFIVAAISYSIERLNAQLGSRVLGHIQEA
jgi:methionyl-tRNA synthetase